MYLHLKVDCCAFISLKLSNDCTTNSANFNFEIFVGFHGGISDGKITKICEEMQKEIFLFSYADCSYLSNIDVRIVTIYKLIDVGGTKEAGSASTKYKNLATDNSSVFM